MTTFTITDEDVTALNQRSFASVKDFLEYLEDECSFKFLYRLPDAEVTPEMREKANEARRQLREDPSSLTDL